MWLFIANVVIESETVSYSKYFHTVTTIIIVWTFFNISLQSLEAHAQVEIREYMGRMWLVSRVILRSFYALFYFREDEDVDSISLGSSERRRSRDNMV
jgi:hypothetical protein